jgi:formamidopyrimidine-DNA glycosylase
VRPTRRAESLTKKQRALIASSTTEVLQLAIAEHGSTLGDQRYRDLDGGLGTYQRHHRVYARTGLACERCGSTVKRVIVGGRSAHFCPTCQS